MIQFSNMLLVVGLGNPGKKYENTRHNVGFEIADEFKEKNNFPDFKFSKKFNALISKKNNVALVKPQTFMNQSGKSVKKLIFNFPGSSEARDSPKGCFSIFNLIVVHDDIDLPLGKIRIAKNRGAGGHKGVESIIRELGTKNFTRFRVGIQPKTGKPKNVEKFVLQKFDKKEEKIIKEVIKQVLIRMCLFVEGYSHT